MQRASGDIARFKRRGEELIQEIVLKNRYGPLGITFRVKAKIKGAVTAHGMCPRVMKGTVEVLFPQHPATSWSPTLYGSEGDNDGKRRISHEVLLKKNAPGLDEVFNVDLK